MFWCCGFAYKYVVGDQTVFDVRFGVAVPTEQGDGVLVVRSTLEQYTKACAYF